MNENSLTQLLLYGDKTEAVAQRCSVKKMFLEISQNSQENTCARVSFLINLQASDCNFIKKETLAQVFSCEFCEISKNTFSYRTPPVATSDKNMPHRTNTFLLNTVSNWLQTINKII